MAVTAVEHGQAADQAEAQIAALCVLPVEALQHQHIALGYRLKPSLSHVQAAAPGQIERRELDPLQVEAVVLGRKLAKPQAVAVFDRRFGARTTHAGAGIKLFEQMCGHVLACLDGLRRGNQFVQLMRSVVGALGCRRLRLQAEAQVTGPILGAMEQIIDLLEIRRSPLQLVFDDAPAPGIGRGVAYRTRDALELRELEHLFGQR